MSYADALTRERAWLVEDLAGHGIPPLLTGVGDNTGPFGIVAAYGRRLAQQAHQLYVCRDPYTERAIDRAGVWREGMHGIALMILWARQTAGTQLETDQQALDDAVERVLTRVRGLPADKSHGGRFLAVGDDVAGIGVEYPDPRTIDTTADAPFGAGSAWTVLVRYVATDSAPG
jgi:hypothetical protein